MGAFDQTAAAAIQSIGNVIGVGLTNKANANLNKKNRDFAREQATTAYERQLAMMREQNQWNSPANQVALYRAAGMNPALMMSQNGVGNASIPSAPQGGASESTPYDYSGMSDLAAPFATAFAGQRDQERLELERSRLALDTNMRALDALNKMKLTDIEGKKARSLANWQSIQGQQLVRNINNEIERTKIQAAAQRSQDAVNKSLVSLNEANTGLSKQQLINLRQELTLIPARLSALYASAAQSYANEEYLRSGVGVNQSQQRLNNASADLKAEETVAQILASGVAAHKYPAEVEKAFKEYRYQKDRNKTYSGLARVYAQFFDNLLEPWKGLLSVAVAP